jgi:hypothetical protein
VARICTICSHPKLVQIDRHLLRGDMLNSIAIGFKCRRTPWAAIVAT